MGGWHIAVVGALTEGTELCSPHAASQSVQMEAVGHTLVGSVVQVSSVAVSSMEISFKGASSNS